MIADAEFASIRGFLDFAFCKLPIGLTVAKTVRFHVNGIVDELVANSRE